MSTSHIVSGAGTFPILETSGASWIFTEGTLPSTGIFDLHPNHAQQLIGTPATSVSLRLTANGVVREIKNLWVEGIRAGPHKFIMRVLLSDRRRFLKYAIAVGRYNIRRDVGVIRVVGSGAAETADLAPDVWYAAYSLKNPLAPTGTVEDKWKATEMIKDILTKASSMEKLFGGTPGLNLVIKDDLSGFDAATPVEDISIAEPGHFAVARALSHFPEVSLTVDDDGDYVLFSRVSGKEAGIVQLLGKELANMGHITYVKNILASPSKVEVYFPIEAEVRFDFRGDTDIAPEVEPPIAHTKRRELFNVAPSPDFINETVHQGTWKSINALLKLWGSPTQGSGPITYKFIRRMIGGYIDISGGLSLQGLANPDMDWMSRYACLVDHYRVTFQIPTRWVDKALSIRPYRVGLADPVNGIRAPAEVFCEWHRINGMRAFFKNKQAAGGNLYHSMPGGAYPNGPPAPWLSGANQFSTSGIQKAAPARVQIVDGDQGIIRLAFSPDMFKVHESTGPSHIVSETNNGLPAPVVNPDSNKGLTFDSIFQNGARAVMKQEFKAAVILSMVPAPTDLHAYYKITILPEDVKDLLPEGADAWLQASAGPVQQILINPGLENAHAMVRWADSRYLDIDKIFGFAEGEPNLDGLVVNHGTTGVLYSGNLSKSPNLDSLAKQAAVKVWAKYADRFQGQAAGHLNADIQLEGWATSVGVHVDGKGIATTTVTLPEAIQEMPYWSALDGGTRGIIFHIPRPRKS